MISKSHSMAAPRQSSAMQNTRAGTSSRPNSSSKYPIHTSAPSEVLTLGRDTPDSLNKRAPASKAKY